FFDATRNNKRRFSCSHSCLLYLRPKSDTLEDHFSQEMFMPIAIDPTKAPDTTPPGKTPNPEPDPKKIPGNEPPSKK
ncbi:hypothetical protein, partial [Alcaligenes faecalis]|uniref:hypothetical protein n=1 Tax=Alcaligenes faecalis TaxID=511 RepID=UPI001E5B4911